MVYTRCSKDDYNAFAQVAGDQSWAWDNILPYAFKVGFSDRDHSNQLNLSSRMRSTFLPMTAITRLVNIYLKFMAPMVPS